MLPIIAVLAVAIVLYLIWDRIEHSRETQTLRVVEDLAGMGELVATSLSPRIDPDACIGSGACVQACPEKVVIGLVAGRAKLVNPLACVGHGACESACPMHAIKLVYGTKTRGVELPAVDPSFQTNRPGVYVIGELGGMGLIRNAVSQGKQAAEHVIRGSGEKHTPPRRGKDGALDAIIVGAGPAGISATLALMEAGLSVLLLEREAFGGTIMHFPRAKVVMTGEIDIPGYGKLSRRTMSKEALVEIWHDIRARTSPPIITGELVESLQATPDGMWLVRSDKSERRAANVLLALGTRGAPRRLGVPGEDAAKVAYRLLEPQEFAGKRVLVVGGGNSAAESALALADAGGCASVGISYRKSAFARLRNQNRVLLDAAIAEGRVQAFMDSDVVRIDPDRVTLSTPGGQVSVPNDAVIVQAGGTPPGDVLRSFGIELVTKYGER